MKKIKLKKKKAVIIGGGLVGSTLADSMAKCKYDVVHVEKENYQLLPMLYVIDTRDLIGRSDQSSHHLKNNVTIDKDVEARPRTLLKDVRHV